MIDLKEQLHYKQFIESYNGLEEENLLLEAKLHTILQMNKNASTLKSVLDERVRSVMEARENERKRILSTLLERVMSDLKDPKTVKSSLRCKLSIVLLILFV